MIANNYLFNFCLYLTKFQYIILLIINFSMCGDTLILIYSQLAHMLIDVQLMDK